MIATEKVYYSPHATGGLPSAHSVGSKDSPDALPTVKEIVYSIDPGNPNGLTPAEEALLRGAGGEEKFMRTLQSSVTPQTPQEPKAGVK